MMGVWVMDVTLPLGPIWMFDLDVRFGFGEFRAICDDLRW